MGRPLGSRNAPKASPVVASNEATTQTAASNTGIKTEYREGAATITVPSSNSSAALFGSPAEQPQEPVIHVEQSLNVPEEPVVEEVAAAEPVQEEVKPAAKPKKTVAQSEEV